MAEKPCNLLKNGGGGIKVASLGTHSINADSVLTVGNLSAEYQGATAYIVTADINGANMSGGVNVSSNYAVDCRNLYSAALSFVDIKVICIF